MLREQTRRGDEADGEESTTRVRRSWRRGVRTAQGRASQRAAFRGHRRTQRRRVGHELSRLQRHLRPGDNSFSPESLGKWCRDSKLPERVSGTQKTSSARSMQGGYSDSLGLAAATTETSDLQRSTVTMNVKVCPRASRLYLDGTSAILHVVSGALRANQLQRDCEGRCRIGPPVEGRPQLKVPFDRLSLDLLLTALAAQKTAIDDQESRAGSLPSDCLAWGSRRRPPVGRLLRVPTLQQSPAELYAPWNSVIICSGIPGEGV